jgi:putative ubiquitin-RnfH superfamily antitoxin RatB of RatAB toxin-antitoxin module
VKVSIVWASPSAQDVVPLELPAGATVGDAVAQSGLVQSWKLDAARLVFAVHGKRRTASAPLADGDRVEITRPLIADPKESRRRRAQSAPLPKSALRTKRRR